MALDQYANFVRGSLNGAVDASQTTFTVDSAAIFPDPTNGEYNLIVWDVGSHPRPDQDPDVEVVRVTARDTGTDELTVTRGQESTTGAAHPDGSALHLSYTAKFADDVAAEIVTDHGALSGLGDDDHTIYLLADGTRAMSGDLDMGGNDVTNASNVTASGTSEAGTFTVGGSTLAQSVVASGQTTLSSGEATVDTGISTTDATFSLALGVDDPNADVDLSGRLFWDDTAGTYQIQIVEATTSVGNPTANYDVIRVR